MQVSTRLKPCIFSSLKAFTLGNLRPKQRLTFIITSHERYLLYKSKYPIETRKFSSLKSFTARNCKTIATTCPYISGSRNCAAQQRALQIILDLADKLSKRNIIIKLYV